MSLFRVREIPSERSYSIDACAEASGSNVYTYLPAAHASQKRGRLLVRMTDDPEMSPSQRDYKIQVEKTSGCREVKHCGRSIHVDGVLSISSKRAGKPDFQLLFFLRR